VFSKPAPRVPEQWYHEDKALADLEKWRVRRRGFLQWKLDESTQALEEMEAVYRDCLRVLGHLSRFAEGDPHPVLGRTFEKHIRIKLTKRLKPGLCSRISIPIQNAFEYSHLLVSGAHRGGDHASAPETCASACLLWRFESHARNRLHNLG